jgi:hypothetical protein
MKPFAVIGALISALFPMLLASGAAEKLTPIEIKSGITQATVYRDRALVTRSLMQSLAPGHSLLKISDLPALLLDESVRVTGKGNATARILDIKVKSEQLEETANGRIQDLEKRQLDLEKQIRVLNDRLELLSRKDDFLKSVLGGNDAKDVEFQKKSILEWTRIIGFLNDNLAGIQEEKRRLEDEKKTLLDHKSVTDHELAQQVQLRSRERKSVWIEMDVRSAGQIQLDISYLVPQASWTPIYDLRFDTESKEMGLTYQALVRQETGEDWEDVSLILSTAQPASDNKPPALRPLTLDQPVNIAEISSGTGSISGTVLGEDGSSIPGISVTLLYGSAAVGSSISNEQGRFFFGSLAAGSYELKCALEGFRTSRQKGIMLVNGKSLDARIVMKQEAIREAIVVTGAAPLLNNSSAGKSFSFAPNQHPSPGDGSRASSSSSSDDEEEIAFLDTEQDTESDAPSTSAQHVAVTFPIGQTETILSNNAPQKVTIAVDSLPSEREYLAVPKLDEQTYLKATVTNRGNVPLLAGKGSVFYDGSYVSTTDIPAVSINEKFPVSIGAESGIKVKWERMARETDESGLLKKRTEKMYEYRITVENFHPTPETITIEDQLPVSEKKEIHVELLSVVPEAKKPAEDEMEREKNNGVIKWSLALKGREKREIRFKYSVSYPKKEQVFNLD